MQSCSAVLVFVRGMNESLDITAILQPLSASCTPFDLRMTSNGSIRIDPTGFGCIRVSRFLSNPHSLLLFLLKQKSMHSSILFVVVLSGALLLGVEGRTWPHCLSHESYYTGYDENHNWIPLDEQECYDANTQRCLEGGIVCQNREHLCGRSCYDPYDSSRTSICWGNFLCERDAGICGDTNANNGKDAKCYNWYKEQCCSHSTGLVCPNSQCDTSNNKCRVQSR